MTTPSRVTGDATKNRRSDIAALIFAPVGLAAFIYGLSVGWDFLGLFWIGLIVVLTTVYLVGRLLGKGGFAAAPCPSCGARLRFTNPERARTLRCDACGAWSTGREAMAPIEEDHVAAEPVFPTPLRADGVVAWPMHGGGAARMCAVCCGEARRTFTIEGSDGVGQVAAMVSPVSVRRVHTLEIPTCGAHGKDGAALLVAGDEATLLLSSWRFHQAFHALNGDAPTR